MPDRVYFGGADDLKFTVADDGTAPVHVKGHSRAKKLPKSAKKYSDEFGINFSAQPEAVTAQTLLNILLDGASLDAGALSGASDVAKTLHYDFGETFIPYYDYKASYVVTGGVGPVTVSGTVDEIDKPFTLQVTAPDSSGTATFFPETGKIEGTSTWHGTLMTTTGDFVLTETDTGYTSTGPVVSCLHEGAATPCSNMGDLNLTFTQQD
jgi:hypothetical protein